MTPHLFVLSIGPVQDFIIAARRTRDLWFGSHLLSEISKAAARTVASTGGQLIFPAPKNLAELDENSDLNVANVILAELPANLTPESVRKSAQACWNRHAEEAKREAASLVRNDIWNEQVRDVIEFYAAWIPLTLPYKEARHRVMHLLAGRKACRDFRPATGHAGVPKSSLDGMRESVWKNPKSTPDLNRALEHRLRLSDGEQLDVVGLTKRLGGGKRGYPSVSRIAADPWLRGGAKSPKSQDDFAALKAQCETLVPKGMLMVSWKDDKGIPPTLSVGLAIGHFMEPLEDLLEYSRAAEKAAKNPDRNGLAVHLHTRGGVPIQIRESWSADMDVRLKQWAEMHRKEQIADKVAYDLRELTRQYEGWPNKTDEEKETLAAALKSEALRLMTLKAGKPGNTGLTEVKTLLGKVRSAEDVLTIAKEIILARRIAAAAQQATGRMINGIQEGSR